MTSRAAECITGEPQVTSKALRSSKYFALCIDAARRRRYSQAQIPNLVAIANTRSRKTAQSFGSVAPFAARILLKLLSSSPPIGQLALFALSADELSIAMPGPAPVCRTRHSSTSQRRIGGHRNL
jgi:hypothetical protein